MILGLGANGHIGFNEPARALQARTHRVTLPETRRSNAALFGGDPRGAAEALSMGMGTILTRARSCCWLPAREGRRASPDSTGRSRRDLPASFLQLHRDVEIVLDERRGETRQL